jgi:hypothetical protein
MFNKEVDWHSEEDMDNFEPRHQRPMLEGIVKCLVIPPRGGKYPPVIPLRYNDRLLFASCRSCATENTVGRRDPDYCCPHNEWYERAFVTTITSAELRAALGVGYTVKKIYRTYHFQQWSSTLFKKYVKGFLKIKVESSGWPAECVTPASRQAWMDQQFRDYGIVIDPRNVKLNPGMRYITKVDRFLL